ncbi:hypothetical protein M413DRAFT_445017 [Hebeloma cylindrosporum]|uniref:Uncharacterized protein n=1 Tax=Hebeloma cylindrosporum TaxID=76867 RepID=A0A0C3BYY3_HEBCY|nr:hypothetical protein M413DRAFT_445017 [Hebeloma cylindrosporum h7]
MVLMEERFDVHFSWANAVFDRVYDKVSQRRQDSAPQYALRAPTKSYPIYIPTLPRMLHALLDQSRYRIAHPEQFVRVAH